MNADAPSLSSPPRPAPDARAMAQAMIDWWADSGVSLFAGEEAIDRLAPVEAESPAAVAIAAPPSHPAAAPPPTASAPAAAAQTAMKFEELGALLQWLSHSDEVPMARPGAARVLPRGAEAAGAMVILDPPDAEDAEAGEPLAGEAWQLGQAMLRAIGIDPDAAYRASISCFHLPAQRPDPAELDRCAAIARDHVRLVRPQRLILMGEGPARALLGEPVARARGRLHRIEGVPTVATFHPRWLMRRSADKALAWRDLLLVREAR